jgi:hypothetical protein
MRPHLDELRNCDPLLTSLVEEALEDNELITSALWARYEEAIACLHARDTRKDDTNETLARLNADDTHTDEESL